MPDMNVGRGWFTMAAAFDARRIKARQLLNVIDTRYSKIGFQIVIVISV